MVDADGNVRVTLTCSQAEALIAAVSATIQRLEADHGNPQLWRQAHDTLVSARDAVALARYGADAEIPE